MCGIAGIISENKTMVSVDMLKRMTNKIAHRGPDGDGHWISGNGMVGFGHRRLSIIDLSHEADQPMHYMDRYTIVFNGEIYNYIELKETLHKQGYTFKTSSDTEVLMAIYDRDKEDCLRHLDGMFSFVIYDNVTDEIFVARDRFGEKPFYYNYDGKGQFIFGSEMKCLWEAGISKEVNPEMLYNYLNNGFLVNPQNDSETFYKYCTKLPHGHYIKMSIKRDGLTIKKYYNIDPTKQDLDITQEQAETKFRELFYTSVTRRMRSDVTVGSSLSGGLDSSLVVSVIDEIKKGTSQLQNTFSAVFPGYAKDERKYMDYVIAQTKVSPHFIMPDDKGMISDIDTLSWHQEEPFGSASIYVQFCVMRLAKENNVTVLLDGQGADEFLAGYHHFYTPFFNELKKKFAKQYSTELNAYNELHKDNPINTLFKKDLRYQLRTYAPSIIDPLKNIITSFNQKKDPFFSSDFYTENRKKSYTDIVEFDSLNNSLHQSLLRGGMQTLLRYADRNSMAHSREVRLPFLFNELVEFVFSLPPNLKIHNGWTKWIMRSAFKNLMPAEIVWRKDKIGYEPPQKSWMDNKEVKDKIHEGKKILLQNHIISNKEFEKPITAGGSLDKNRSWALWMAANLFNK